MNELIRLFVWIVALGIAVYVAKAFLVWLQAPPPFLTITYAIACLLLLVLVANFFGAGIPLGMR